MKRKLSLGSYKIYPFKHGISKFEIAGVKIADFVSAQSWAILPSKMVFESRGQNAHRGPTQCVCVADCYYIVNALDLPFASPIAMYR